MAGVGRAAQVEQLRQALKKVIGLQAVHKARQGALTSLKTSYACTMERTDFKGTLETALGVIRSAPAAEDSEALQKFEREVWNVNHQGQPMPGEEDAELAILDSGMGDYRNLKCPLSGIDIHDLEDPVEDQQQIIYERKFIEGYIKKKGREAPCPHHGTTHKVKLSDLHTCIELVREKKRRKLAATQGFHPSQGSRKNNTTPVKLDEDEEDGEGGAVELD